MRSKIHFAEPGRDQVTSVHIVPPVNCPSFKFHGCLNTLQSNPILRIFHFQTLGFDKHLSSADFTGFSKRQRISKSTGGRASIHKVYSLFPTFQQMRTSRRIRFTHPSKAPPQTRSENKFKTNWALLFKTQ